LNSESKKKIQTELKKNLRQPKIEKKHFPFKKNNVKLFKIRQNNKKTNLERQIPKYHFHSILAAHKMLAIQNKQTKQVQNTLRY
jgi:hypothetical protein